MAVKKQSFRDILRSSFPVDVGGLLGGPEVDQSAISAVARDETVSQSDTLSLEGTVSYPDTVPGYRAHPLQPATQRLSYRRLPSPYLPLYHLCLLSPPEILSHP